MRSKEDFLRTINTGLKFMAPEPHMTVATRLRLETNLASTCGMLSVVGVLTVFLICSKYVGMCSLAMMMLKAGLLLVRL